LIEQAKIEISKAWEVVRINGLEFGKICAEWEQRLNPDELLSVYQSLAIKPSDASWWIRKYKGLKQAKQERRVHRAEPDNFEDIRALALAMLQIGFKELEKDASKDIRQLRNAKDWAIAKLKSKLL